MGSATLGIAVLDGSARMRPNGQLINLEELASTPGPPGPQGEQGPRGPLALQAPLARQVLRGQRVLKDQRVLRDQRVLKAPLAKTAKMGPLIHQITTTKHKLIFCS